MLLRNPIHIIVNVISDISETSIIQQVNSIASIRKHVNILVIDDNPFVYAKALVANGYSLKQKNDIDSIKDVEGYDIILCDISGVGNKLGLSHGGASIIGEIHKNYPQKRIIAYTSYTYDADYNKYFSLADYIAPKDIDTDAWIDILDEQVRNSINPVQQWIKIRNHLLQNGVSTLTVAILEDKFVRSVKKKDFSKLQAYVKGDDSRIGSIISDFLVSVCAKVILGTIGGA